MNTFNRISEGGEEVEAAPLHPELDPEAALLRSLAQLYEKFPSDIEGLRRLAFAGVRDKISNALDALRADALETFMLRRDNVLAALDGLLAVFPLGEGDCAREWRKRYAERMRLYGDHGETFSDDPESRYLKVAAWAKRQLEKSASFTTPAQPSAKQLSPYRVLLEGISHINSELVEMQKSVRSAKGGVSEAERDAAAAAWYEKASRDIFSAVSAFLAIPSK